MNKSMDLGLLVIRLGVGGSVLAFRALGNLFGGPELWSHSGSFIFETSINISPEIVGATLAILECLGGLMLITGALFRTGAFLLILTAIPGLMYQLGTATGSAYAGLGSSFVSIVLLSVYLGLLISGPGAMAMRLFSRSSGGANEEPLPTFDSLS